MRLIQNFGVENLNPIAIRILDESQALHTSFVRLLDKLNLLFGELKARLVHIGNQNANVTEATRFRVARVILLVGIRFGAPVAINRETL